MSIKARCRDNYMRALLKWQEMYVSISIKCIKTRHKCICRVDKSIQWQKVYIIYNNGGRGLTFCVTSAAAIKEMTKYDRSEAIAS